MKRWRTPKTAWSFALDALIVVLLGLFATGSEASKPSKEGGDASGLTWQWRYDRDGRVSEIVAPGKVTTRVTHGDSKAKVGTARTSTVDFGGEKRTFTWDAKGRLVKAQGSGGTITINHNAAGLPAEVRAGSAPAIRYAYDVQNRLTETRIGNDTAIRYRYDYLGRPAAIATPAGDIAYSYHRATNTVMRRLPNGLRTIWVYDDEGKLLELTHADAKNVVIAGYAYAYRPDGLVGEITEQNQRGGRQVCRYRYDLMQRLADVACDGKGRSYRLRYDSLGNLSESQTARGAALRFTSTPAGALATDSRGATRTDERGHIRRLPSSPKPIEYAFNGAGELSSAVANGKKLGYAYNALGLLTSRRADGRETRYLPDPFADAWRPLWQRDADGTETVTVWDGAVPLVALQGNKVSFRLEDHLGSVRMEVDAGGRVAARHDYTPFGAREDAEAGGELRPGFAGLFWDPAAKVYHAMARAYDPVTARFLQPDPQLRMPGVSKHSHSLYAYAGGDPVNFVDRNGAEAIPLGPRPLMLTDGNGYAVSGSPPVLSPVVSFDAHSVWWSAFWKDVRGHLLDAHRAKDILADYSVSHINNARGSGFAGGLTATVLDVVGGYIPGEGGNQGQAYASVGWSLLLGGFNSGDAAITALNTINLTRTVSSTIINTAQHNYKAALLDTVSLGGAVLGSNAKNLMSGAYSIPSGQLEFNFVNRALVNTANRFRLESDLIDVYGYYSLAHDTYQAGFRGGANSDVPLSRGVSFSTTGPGKRGGRGGGITRPPSWKPPGSQGRPPPGPQPPLRGPPPRGSGGRSMSMAPSPVGGVYLGGAGKALEGFGQLKGVAIDETTGKLVLIGSDSQKLDLPPLRLDDVVTVFRAVYNHGRSPSVTIDPDERNPEGPTMDVRHGPGTEGTYVGWVLFECDRIMKTYQLGRDNVTREIKHSQVPGYAKTLDAVFFGDAKQQGSKWERFWIVPASVRRFDAAKAGHSLFEVPLKVNTQTMRWKKVNKNGREINALVDDDSATSSAGAMAFTNWYTEHYDEIADEVRLSPPPGSGLDKPVAIFHELRRIALIAAIAERLRDLGEPMPLWMHDYSVAPFPVPKTTASLTIEKKRGAGSAIHVARIFGGVNLAPADRDVHTYSDAKGAAARPAPREDLAFVNLSRNETAVLTSKVPELARVDEPIGTVHAVTTPQEKKLSVAVLPGAKTRGLAPNRQEATDMVVPIGLGRSIGLTRYYNSFFDPAGAFGKGWTLNLPELLKTPVPVKRDGKQSEYRVVQHLVSPLGTVDIRFDRTEKVEPYGVKMVVAKDHPEIAGVAGGESKIVGTKTSQVLFRDGTTWHFDADGRLVLVEADGTATRYLRDSAGRVQQIVGYVGTDAVAEIRLGYDREGRIVEAKANQVDDLRKQAQAEVSKLNFEYGNDGRLRSVSHPEAKKGTATEKDWVYSYEADRLAKVGGAGRAETSFGYDALGRMLWKKQGDRKIRYSVTSTSQGTMLTQETGGAGTPPEKWTYDGRLRPVEADIGGGTVRWRYGKDNEVSETVSRDGKLVLTRSTSRDGRTETAVLTDGPTYEVRKDATGHPTTLSVNGAEAARISWRQDGTVAGLRTGDTEIRPLRHKNGWPNGVIVSAPNISGKTSEWLQEEWDVMGRPTAITDSSGLEYRLSYDDRGRLRTFGRLMKDGKLMGANLVYDSDGRVTGIDSSWGKEKRVYLGDGMLKLVELKRQGTRAVTTHDKHGRPVSHSAFDGGTTHWRYHSDNAGATLRAIELPNGKRIDYLSHEATATRGAQARLDSTIVHTTSDAEGRVTTLTWGAKAP